jgi:hypothetical protein
MLDSEERSLVTDVQRVEVGPRRRGSLKGAEILILVDLPRGELNQDSCVEWVLTLAMRQGFVSVSFCYLVLRRVLQLVALRVRSNEWKELEIVVRRHELAILRRHTGRPAIAVPDRLFLAAASRLLPRTRWPSFIVTPATVLRWHRRSHPRRAGHPDWSGARIKRRDRLGGVIHEYGLAA